MDLLFRSGASGTRSTLFLLLAVMFMGARASRDGTYDTMPVTPLAPNAYAAHFWYQPWLDYDTDSCYNVAAIEASGWIDNGLPTNEGGDEPPKGPTNVVKGCRDADRLHNYNQVYSRGRCNNGWCAYLYAYYFEKDVSGFGAGHRFEWEHIVVWTDYANKGSGIPIPRFVSHSYHTGWQSYAVGKGPIMDGTHFKMVYNKDGAVTHVFRIASPADDAGLENHDKQWKTGNLVAWWKMGGWLQSLLYTPGKFDGTTPKLSDGEFSNALKAAKPAGVGTFIPELNAPECQAPMSDWGGC